MGGAWRSTPSSLADRVSWNRRSARASLTETLQTDGGGVWPVSWSPDGKSILYVTNSRETSNDIWVLPVGGGKPYPFQQTPASENWAAFSPDGRWVAYSSTASSDVPEVFVTRFPDKGPSWRISADGGSQARWRRDGIGDLLSRARPAADGRRGDRAQRHDVGHEGRSAVHDDVPVRRVSRIRRLRRRLALPGQHGVGRRRADATGACARARARPRG